jgi:Domain of Unknown Function (DUF748)
MRTWLRAWRNGTRRLWTRVERQPWLKWPALGLVTLAMLVILLSFFLDEPIRRYVEAEMNRSMKGYTAHIRAANFHPIGLSLTLKDLSFVQDAHPDPPVLHVPQLDASVQWKALLFGGIVADFAIFEPTLFADIRHIRAEAADPTPLDQHGWQEAFEKIYPLKINRVRIRNGTVTYVDEGPSQPLELKNVQVIAENIRNIRSKERTYPSMLRAEATVFEKGRVTLDGHADFLAEPQPGIKANVALENIELDYFKPLLRHQNLAIRGGRLAAEGTIEYAPTIKMVDLTQATIRNVELDYIHTPQKPDAPKQVARETAKAAEKATNAPDLRLRAQLIDIADSKVGMTVKTTNPPYRLFFDVSRLRVENFTNHHTEGIMVANLKGKFMGSGDTAMVAHFRPDVKGPNFDMQVEIERTDLRTMNDMLRAYGKFDVVGGVFTFYSEVAVKNAQVSGYVKPLFKDVRAFDPEQDRAKSGGQKLYERVVGGVSKILKNIPRKEVATKVEISGPIDNPKTSTMQAVVKLVQNAFFNAILPGFEREVQG